MQPCPEEAILPAFTTTYGGSSIGRALVSKTSRWGFKSLPPCSWASGTAATAPGCRPGGLQPTRVRAPPPTYVQREVAQR